MVKILILISIILLIHYVIIIIHAGINTSFAIVWPIMAVLFFALALLEYFHILTMTWAWFPNILKYFIILLAIVSITIFLVIECMILSKMYDIPKESIDYIIVLGAQVRKEALTTVLRTRIEKATTYLCKHPNTKVICSGGQGTGEDISEAEAMRRYLVLHNIREDRILIEDQSTTTKENIDFSFQLIPNKNAKVAICTNNFHVYRAVALAKKSGIKNAYGLGGKGDPYLFINYLYREFFAIVKEKIKGNI